MNLCHIGDQPIEAVSAITDLLKGSFLNNGSMFKNGAYVVRKREAQKGGN
jgi:hypothetical protein